MRGRWTRADRQYGPEKWGYEVAPCRFVENGVYVVDLCLMVGHELTYRPCWVRVVEINGPTIAASWAS